MAKSLGILMRVATLVVLLLNVVINCEAQERRHYPTKRIHATESDSIAVTDSIAAAAAITSAIPEKSGPANHQVVVEDMIVLRGDSLDITAVDTIGVKSYNSFEYWEERETNFNPDPTRAVWMSALFPGLGQIYNRRYWKLPIIVGAYLGLGYATSWNNGMLTDYTRAYRDIMDSDPTTKSYMDFFPPTTQESDLDEAWLKNVLKSRKNFYRRNRDLCIISMVGIYLVAMVDAYVDASLSHFDITPELSMDVAPAVFIDGRNTKPSVGIQWAFTF